MMHLLNNSHMKQNIFFLLTTVFILVHLAGCKPVDNSDRERQVMVYFDAKSLSGTANESADENAISKLTLFGINDQNKVIETHPDEVPSESGIPLTISRNVKKIYAIANSPVNFEIDPPNNVSDLLNLTGDFTTAPGAPFLMSGIGVVVDFDVRIELIRVVAKIEFIQTGEFKIEEVAVIETPDKGYIFEQEKFSVPPTADKKAYKAIASKPFIFYVAESAAQKPTRFEVKGQYLNKPATHTFTLKSNEKEIDLVRNTHYTVGISSITVDKCTISLDVKEWSPEDTDPHFIPDEAFN
jgi:hypothetical protein